MSLVVAVPFSSFPFCLLFPCPFFLLLFLLEDGKGIALVWVFCLEPPSEETVQAKDSAKHSPHGDGSGCRARSAVTHVESTRLENTEPTGSSQAFGVIRNQLAELKGSSESPPDSPMPKNCLQAKLLVNIFHSRFPLGADSNIFVP